jgi:hypothetical protein
LVTSPGTTSEHLGATRADAAPRAGDENDLAVEAEAVECSHELLLSVVQLTA